MQLVLIISLIPHTDGSGALTLCCKSYNYHSEERTTNNTNINTHNTNHNNSDNNNSDNDNNNTNHTDNNDTRRSPTVAGCAFQR